MYNFRYEKSNFDNSETRRMHYMYINEKLQEFEKYIVNKRVALIGLGISNLPLIDYFVDKGAQVTVFDKKNIDEIDKTVLDKITSRCVKFSFGEHNLVNLIGFDLILRSPTCRPDSPELKAESIRGAIVTSEIELFMEMCPGKIIAVTGSDGKTTTSSLIYAILKEKGYLCYLGGNIGTPLFTKLKEMKPDCYVVLELSSFQLMGIQSSPEIAVVTNVSPNHLDIHKNYEEYIECKKNIFKFQDENGKVVLNYDNDVTRYFSSEANGKVRFFSSQNRLDNGVIYDNGIIKSCEDGVRMHIMTIDETISIHGVHNYENICAAIAATEGIVEPSIQSRAITKFKGVEHRLEFVKTINGVKWYNDSIGTSPTRTIAGLKSFNQKVILIAGGYDKKLDYKCIAKPILDNVTSLILLGATAEKIEQTVQEQAQIENVSIPVYRCNSLEECVIQANEIAKENDIVLFSPASASFDMFKNFADRGEKFKELVLQLETDKILKN